MSQYTQTTGSAGSNTSGSTTEAAKEATRETADTAKGEAMHLADSARQEIGNVTSTATDQMRRLMDQSRSELTEQARSQQQRLSGNLRTLTDELDAMARNSGQQGVAHDVARQVSQQARTLSDWLDRNEPGAVLDEVSRFARRKPGTFLAIAAGVGFLSGRLTRGLASASSENGGQSSIGTGYTASGSATYPTGRGNTAGTTGQRPTTGMSSMGTTDLSPDGVTSAEAAVDGPVETTGTGTYSGTVAPDEAARQEWTDRGDVR